MKIAGRSIALFRDTFTSATQAEIALVAVDAAWLVVTIGFVSGALTQSRDPGTIITLVIWASLPRLYALGYSWARRQRLLSTSSLFITGSTTALLLGPAGYPFFSEAPHGYAVAMGYLAWISAFFLAREVRYRQFELALLGSLVVGLLSGASGAVVLVPLALLFALSSAALRNLIFNTYAGIREPRINVQNTHVLIWLGTGVASLLFWLAFGIFSWLLPPALPDPAPSVEARVVTKNSTEPEASADLASRPEDSSQAEIQPPPERVFRQRSKSFLDTPDDPIEVREVPTEVLLARMRQGQGRRNRRLGDLGEEPRATEPSGTADPGRTKSSGVVAEVEDAAAEAPASPEAPPAVEGETAAPVPEELTEVPEPLADDTEEAGSPAGTDDANSVASAEAPEVSKESPRSSATGDDMSARPVEGSSRLIGPVVELSQPEETMPAAEAESRPESLPASARTQNPGALTNPEAAELERVPDSPVPSEPGARKLPPESIRPWGLILSRIAILLGALGAALFLFYTIKNRTRDELGLEDGDPGDQHRAIILGGSLVERPSESATSSSEAVLLAYLRLQYDLRRRRNQRRRSETPREHGRRMVEHYPELDDDFHCLNSLLYEILFGEREVKPEGFRHVASACHSIRKRLG